MTIDRWQSCYRIVWFVLQNCQIVDMETSLSSLWKCCVEASVCTPNIWGLNEQIAHLYYGNCYEYLHPHTHCLACFSKTDFLTRLKKDLLVFHQILRVYFDFEDSALHSWGHLSNSCQLAFLKRDVNSNLLHMAVVHILWLYLFYIEWFVYELWKALKCYWPLLHNFLSWAFSINLGNKSHTSLRNSFLVGDCGCVVSLQEPTSFIVHPL